MAPGGSPSGTSCTHYCSDDDFQTCGGSDTDVYADPSYADPAALASAGAAGLTPYYKYLGCYYSPNFITANAMVAESCQPDVGTCYGHCATNGFPFAAAIWNDPNGASCGYRASLPPPTRGRNSPADPLILSRSAEQSQLRRRQMQLRPGVRAQLVPRRRHNGARLGLLPGQLHKRVRSPPPSPQTYASPLPRPR